MQHESHWPEDGSGAVRRLRRDLTVLVASLAVFAGCAVVAAGLARAAEAWTDRIDHPIWMMEGGPQRTTMPS